MPVAVGELLVGIMLGKSWLNKIPTTDSTLKLLSAVGFALLMFSAGSHIDYRAFTKRAFATVYKIILANTVVAIAVGLIIDQITHFSNWRLIATLSFSSSAAFVIPLLAYAKPDLSTEILIAQVTIADAIGFIALPFFTQKHDRIGAFTGSLIVIAVAVALYFLLLRAKRRGYLDRTHIRSKEDHLGIELRISLGLLLLVATLAVKFHASVMIAGFALGTVLASIGLPHRLARQLFAVSDGFFAPLYFIWLGATIDITKTFHSTRALTLALCLVVAAFIAHAPALFFKQPASNLFLASAQLGIPAAAVTLASASGLLNNAQSGAIMLAAVISVIVPAIFLKSR
jgi:Kef-type K+ transport system membrane component KefB